MNRQLLKRIFYLGSDPWSGLCWLLRNLRLRVLRTLLTAPTSRMFRRAPTRAGTWRSYGILIQWLPSEGWSAFAADRGRCVAWSLGRHRSYEHFSASSFTDSDITQGDVTAGEDPVVRQAAIDALGNMYGTVVAIDPSNGRILAMVNQKLALSSGAEPCSTIKVSVALAALQEGIVTKDTPVNLGGIPRRHDGGSGQIE